MIIEQQDEIVDPAWLFGAEPMPQFLDGVWVCKSKTAFGVGKTISAAKLKWRMSAAYRINSVLREAH